MTNSFWKNRQVTAYVALKHHTRFIIPIMEELARLGAKTSYLVAQAERSQEITAIETDLNYHHIFDYVDASDRETIFKNYKMLKSTFGKALLEDTLYSLQVPTVLDKSLFAVAQEYTGFQNFFKKNKPDICLSLHELNRWGKIFSFHAKQNGIPHIVLQEGLLTSAAEDLTYVLTGHVQNSTLCLVWGEGSRKKLVDFEAPEDRVIPAGNTHLSNEIKKISKQNIRGKKRKIYKACDKFVMVLFFSINLPQKIEEFIELMSLPRESDSLKLFLKFHPGTSRLQIDSWLERFPKSVTNKILSIHGEEDTYALMAMSDLCLLVEASTIGLEALALGCPLVLLNLEADVIYKDKSLVDKKAAMSLTVKELCNAVLSGKSFKELINQEGVNAYLENELIDIKNSIQKVVGIMEGVTRSNQSPALSPLTSEIMPDQDWSIILSVTDQPELFLATLENISISSGEENYEVILIAPPHVSHDIQAILDSLEGDVSILKNHGEDSLATMMNKAAKQSKGKTVLFMDNYLAPEPGWLGSIRSGQKQFGALKIFGGKISNRFENIIHAGMVVNTNCQPVSAYLHLDKKFPHTCKTRHFQMVDYFTGMDRQLFLELGGFHPETGRYKFLDFCLRYQEKSAGKNKAVVYLHDLGMVRLSSTAAPNDPNHAICFYGKWNGRLWETEDQLYANDGVSTLQLSAARMTRAQEMANRI